MSLRLIRPAQRLRGEILVPGDKSISHRAVIFNSIADGTAKITNFLAGEDCLATMACMQQMGVQLQADLQTNTVTINGSGLHGLHEPSDILNAANSGTTMRLLAGLLSGFDFFSVLNGDDSLRNRPMRRVIEPLQQMGANIHGRKADSLAPLAIRGGNLKGIEYRLNVASAQLKSCLLLASLYADSPTILSGLIASRDHSERMLQAMGADLRVSEQVIVSKPITKLQAQNVAIPGDMSSAAFWLVAGSIHPDAELYLPNVGVNPSRTGLLETLLEMGADISRFNERSIAGEPIADLRIRSAKLKGITVGGSLIPRLADEVPILAVAGLAAEGITQVQDAAELRVKETDRLATIASEFAKIGAIVETQPAGLSLTNQVASLKEGRVDSYGDHRLAMALAVAALLLPQGQALELNNPECASVSYPTFWEDFERVCVS